MSTQENGNRLTAKEIDEMIAGQVAVSISKLEARFRSLGCGTEVGCIAGKRHEQYHADKLNSDLENLKAFREGAEVEFKTTARKMSEASIMLNDVIARLQSMLKTFDFLDEKIDAALKKTDKLDDKIDKEVLEVKEDVKKRLDLFDGRMWLMISGVAMMCIMSVWSIVSSNNTAKKVSENVAKINSTDINNQGNTEAWLAVLASKVSGSSMRDIIREYEEEKKKIADKIKEGVKP